MKRDLFRFAMPLVLAATGIAGPAVAKCAGSNAVDTCLVGVWGQSGGGAAEWMRRQLPPGMTMPQVRMNNTIMVLKEDGTFWTSPVTGDMKMPLDGASGTMQATGHIKARASGRWSASGGKLRICTDNQDFEGQAGITLPGAGHHVMPLAAPSAGGPMNLDYRCAGNGLETIQVIPGAAEPMTTQYERRTATGGKR